MILNYLALVLLFGMVASETKYCCTPPQWESEFNLISGGFSMAQTYFIQEYQNVSIDSNAKKVASSVKLINNGETTLMRVIQDYPTGKQYTITNGVCKTSPVTPWTPKCVPDDAQLIDKTFFGTGDKKIDFDVYTYTMGGGLFYVDVASADCTPLFLSISGTQNNARGYTVGTYSNMTLGIKDPTVFDVPAICNQSINANIEQRQIHPF